jgi:hypothetical protein
MSNDYLQEQAEFKVTSENSQFNIGQCNISFSKEGGYGKNFSVSDSLFKQSNLGGRDCSTVSEVHSTANTPKI